jgi:hypothetical protein
MRLILVSCSNEKRVGQNIRADMLYCSPLFQKSSHYARKNGDCWAILSAKHGLLHPTDYVTTYDCTLNELGVEERRRWSERVAKQIIDGYQPGPDDTVEIMAGNQYRQFLVPHLKKTGCTVSEPLAGLAIGMQLKWLEAHK